MIDAHEIDHIHFVRTVEMKSNEEWSSQLGKQFLQLHKKSEIKKKFRTSMGFRLKILWKSCIFSGFLCNCINCIHNCEDHSFDNKFCGLFILPCITTGSPSALSVGLGFRGHLVEFGWSILELLGYYLMPNKCKNLKDMKSSCLSVCTNSL